MAWIEKRGTKYKVYWDVGSPENRKRRSESFDDSESADKFKKKIEYEASIGLCYDPSKMTFGEYLDEWLKIHGPNLAPKTLASYECEINNHIKPCLGDTKLSKLSPMQLQNYYTSLREEGRAAIVKKRLADLEEKLKSINVADKEKISNNKRAQKRARAELDKLKREGREGLSPTTVAYHHRIIHKALKQAYKWQMVARNAADAVEVPRADKKEMEYLKKSQVNQFMSCIKESPDYPVIMTAIFTGMRQGELLGLRWKDVDFDNGTIRVQQQLQYLPAKGYYFKDPKQNSKRSIPMPLPLNAILRKVRKEQDAIKAVYAEAANKNDGKNEYKDNGLVFCNPDGTPADGNDLTKRFKILLEKNEFDKIPFHALRHTFATMCRAAGMKVEDIQDLLGHADISTTKKMYTHVEIEPLRKAIDQFTQYLES